MKKFLPFIKSLAVMAMIILMPVSMTAQVTYASGTCGKDGSSNVKWKISGTGGTNLTLTIYGQGEMEDYDGYGIQPWQEAYTSDYTVRLMTRVTSVVVEEGITTIGSYSFAGQNYVTKITLGEDVREIHNYAMCSNDILETVYFPANNYVTEISDLGIFHNCHKLSQLYGKNIIDGGLYSADGKILYAFPPAYPGGVARIAESCEDLCINSFNNSQLNTIYLPKFLWNMGYDAFSYYTGLTDIYADMEIMPTYQLRIFSPQDGWSKSQTTVHVHHSTYEAFLADPEWEGFKIVADLDPDFEGQCGDNINYSFEPSNGTLTLTGTGDMWTFTSSKPAPWTGWSKWADKYDVDIKELIIGEGITSVSNSAFLFNYHLSKVSFPSTLLSIGGGAFEWCDIQSVTLPASLQMIGASAFYRNENLYSVAFGESTDLLIYEDAFNMTSIHDIYAPWTDRGFIPAVAEATFGDIVANQTKLHIKSGTRDIYLSRNVWKDMIIVEDLDGTAIGEVRIDQKNATKIIRNGQVIIIRGEEEFNVIGKEIK